MKLTDEQQQVVELAKHRLSDLQVNGDKEVAHVAADDVLCDLLNALGLSEVVALYEKIDKLYA